MRKGKPNFNAAFVVLTSSEGRGKMDSCALRGRQELAYLGGEFPAEISATRIGLDHVLQSWWPSGIISRWPFLTKAVVQASAGYTTSPSPRFTSSMKLRVLTKLDRPSTAHIKSVLLSLHVQEYLKKVLQCLGFSHHHTVKVKSIKMTLLNSMHYFKWMDGIVFS